MPCKFHLALLRFKLGNNLRMYFWQKHVYLYICNTLASLIRTQSIHMYFLNIDQWLILICAGGLSISHARCVLLTCLPLSHGQLLFFFILFIVK